MKKNEYILKQDVINELIRTAGIGKRAIDRIQDLPAADVNKIIKCKDCDYYAFGECMYHRYMQPDDFCSWADQKKDLIK